MSDSAIYRVLNGRIVQVGSGTEDDPIRDETVGSEYLPLGGAAPGGHFCPLDGRLPDGTAVCRQTWDARIAGEVLEWLTGHETPSPDWRIGLPPSHDERQP